jgi:hypothetical protein
VSDDRYTRDRLRLDLAQRLIHHEARTFTIRQWTGLSDDRIRKLYRSYMLNQNSAGGARRICRHRGKSPRQAAFFFRNAELHFQSAQLASLFVTHGLLRTSDSQVECGYTVGSIESGAVLCQSYEAYLELHTIATISFEHAWFLLMALSRKDELGIARCTVCGGVRLHDLLSKRRHACGNCELAGLVGPAPSTASASSVPNTRS